MFPLSSSLVTQCLGYLETRFLKIDSDEHCEDLVLKVIGEEGWDQWYKVKVVWTGSRESEGLFCVRKWTLAVTTIGLVLRVIRARRLFGMDWGDSVLTPIEHNPRIRETIQKIRYQAIRTIADTWEEDWERRLDRRGLNSGEDGIETEGKDTVKRVLPFGNSQVKATKMLHRTYKKREITLNPTKQSSVSTESEEHTGSFSLDSLLFLKYVYKV